ncbi:MAG: cell division protein FtsA [Candidatus Staskawiczbacteria bacterium RIFCSPLOWO2_01_FULL_33_9]|uniref:Cell division protein FtsA n=1 Tax=Candidatus Staskawiczbacteria bacterium RIFCSPLOWO2_01_FULL_33_9 TaxID=1802211 RepID=A0A1G2I982_9BACT|nr:MAG: cell division protein FtsA [Candidatus Staskawiczbacteria bacterium RIFCSPLOWO2_01_FULL_33_9]
MAKGHIVAGLDIGTNTIKILVAQQKGRELELLHYVERPSFGLRKGAVVNVEETSKNIRLLISDVERDLGRKINSVFVNIGGSRLYVTHSDGIISVSRANQVISQEDIDRVLQATKAINISSNEDILDVLPKEYIIDDQKGIKQPLGLTGKRLEAKVLLLCYFQPDFINLSQAVLNSKLQIDDIITSPLAAADAVLTPQQKELGVALIDMGAATTSLAVFEEGDLIHFAVLPIGSANITNDIAIGLRTEVATAEDIKKQHGTCIFTKKKDQSNKKLEITDKSSDLSFTKKDLVDIIEPRVSEIFDLIQKELKKIGRQELLPGGIVLSGGGAKLSKLKELVKQQLKLPCAIGSPSGIIGIEDDPGLATVVGLVLAGSDIDGSVGGGILGLLRDFSKKLIKMFRVFIP